MTFKSHTTATMVLLSAILFPLPASGSAQSLGEVARRYRKELEARKKKGEVPVKVFTNDDIARISPPTTASSSKQSPATRPSQPIPESTQAGSLQPPETAHGKTPAGSSAGQSGKAEGSEKSKEYWQARFKAARSALAHAKEEQTLLEDELRLLQIQQARELNPDRSRKLNSQIDAKGIELETKRAATEKAQAALDETEKEFKKSGAPQDWIQVGKSPD
jgi:hypothetical protein